MRYTNLGKSNLKVSRICLGTMHFGNRTSEDEAIKIMAAKLPTELAELVVINQVRLLRNTPLLEELEQNTNLNNDQKRRLHELRETFKIGAEPPANDVARLVRARRHAGDDFLFVVDASWSMAVAERMEATKGAIMSLLTDAYQRRDRVGLVVFQKDRAGIVEIAVAAVRQIAGLAYYRCKG